MKHFKLITLITLVLSASLNSQTDSIQKNNDKERAFQLTFVSPIGTNGLDCYKYTNHFSLNILAGVSKGLNGFEAGTLANVILKDVNGVQFAGFTNVVLGSVNGVQFASYFNYCGKDLKGVTFAGLGNVGLGELHGGQFSAGFNFNRKGGHGVQVAAHTNVVLGNFKGTQVACIANIATKNIDGAQISAGVNYAKKVKGIQVGLINIADSVDGASIGFLNFIKHGKHQLEFSADELFYTNISYRTGTSSFYNIFSAGYKPGSKDNVWHFGYGAGTSFKLKNKLWADISVTSHHINTNGFSWGTSELTRLYCGVEYKFAKKLSVAAGPTFNFYISDALLSKYNSNKTDIVPYHSFSRTTNDNFNVKGWIGGRIAIRFL